MPHASGMHGIPLAAGKWMGLCGGIAVVSALHAFIGIKTIMNYHYCF